MTSDQLIVAAIPTAAILVGVIRNEFALNSVTRSIDALTTRVNNLESRLDSRMETLDRDLRGWANIMMNHNTDIVRLKDKTGLEQ